MATLTVQKASLTGLEPAMVTPTATTGDKFYNSGRTVLKVANGSGAGITVTVDAKTPCDLGVDHDLTVSVGAGKTLYIGPFAKNRFDDSQGLVSVVCSSVTSVTVAAIEVA
ncbi:MAG: hypothetical protein A4E30_00756 [Methanomassiliicoccales archaeon PtaB.Bin215]|nr:MAG: hypothetical protein A4E30_00756 [Methanomassiliicoccales archaeon PtaB.Bin215]